MKSRPFWPIASSTGIPKSRSAARLAHRTWAPESTTSTASGRTLRDRGQGRDGVTRVLRAACSPAPSVTIAEFIDPSRRARGRFAS